MSSAPELSSLLWEYVLPDRVFFSSLSIDCVVCSMHSKWLLSLSILYVYFKTCMIISVFYKCIYISKEVYNKKKKEQ